MRNEILVLVRNTIYRRAGLGRAGGSAPAAGHFMNGPGLRRRRPKGAAVDFRLADPALSEGLSKRRATFLAPGHGRFEKGLQAATPSRKRPRGRIQQSFIPTAIHGCI
jgi:hypothetical protein